MSSDLSTTDLNSKGKKTAQIGIKIVRRSTLCDLKVSEVSDKKTFRIKFVLTHFKMSFFFFNINPPYKDLSPGRSLVKQIF